jgi:crotonobetainyl-CoA:carnitine CoA-transferase CaiB-like acyl-CoA transferase
MRIVDFTQMMAGPWGTQMLADLGAEVIKIERPGTGEWERGLESMGELLAGDSPFFHAMNRNKKSLTIDLKRDEAKEIVYRLVEDADVVAENFRPGVLDRLGYGYEKLSEINPGIVYLSSSGYGSSGPYVGRPGQDLLIQGMSGMLAHTGKGDDLPTPAGTSVVDEGTAMVNAMSILAALFYKERTGRGQKIEANLLSTAVAMQCQEAVAYLNLGQRFVRSEAGIGSPWLSAPFGVYPTADGFMTISMSALPTIGRIFGLLELEKYENPMDGFHKRDEIKRAIEEKTPEKTTAEWLEILNENKVWCGPVNTFDDVFSDPQVEHNGLVVTMEHPKAGEVKLIGFPARFSETPATYRSAAPLVGEHNEEILGSLGYDEAGIRRLEEQGVTGRGARAEAQRG